MTKRRQTDSTPCEVLVLGGGPVGMAFALWLAGRWRDPASITVVGDPAAERTVGARPLALSEGSRQLLARIVAFPARHGRIESIEVSLAGEPGRVQLSACDQEVAALGYVVRYGELAQTLLRALERSGVTRVARGEALPAARLTVHAEGDAGQAASTRVFGQSALVADVVASAPIEARAFERFTRSGPLALLPLPEPGRYSLVWCAPDASARDNARLDADAFAARLGEAFGPRLGRLRRDGPSVVVALARRARTQLARGGEVWIGNAAQTLHPVAGQGLNLGLRDAFELAEFLSIEHREHGALGAATLRAFERSRRRDRSLTIGITDALASALAWPLLRPAQSLAMDLVNQIAPLRRTLARQFMFGARRAPPQSIA